MAIRLVATHDRQRAVLFSIVTSHVIHPQVSGSMRSIHAADANEGVRGTREKKERIMADEQWPATPVDPTTPNTTPSATPDTTPDDNAADTQATASYPSYPDTPATAAYPAYPDTQATSQFAPTETPTQPLPDQSTQPLPSYAQPYPTYPDAPTAPAPAMGDGMPAYTGQPQYPGAFPQPGMPQDTPITPAATAMPGQDPVVPGQYGQAPATPYPMPGAPQGTPQGAVPPYQYQGMPPQGAYPAAPAPAPAKKPMSKQARIGIIVGVIAAVVVVALVAVFALGRPGKLTADDYLDGMDQITAMSTSQIAMGDELYDVFSGAYDGDTLDDDALSGLRQSITEFEETNAAFTELPVYEDEAVKAAFDAYQAKASAMVTFIGDFGESAVALSAVSVSCNETPSASMWDDDFYTQYNTYIGNCQTDLEALSAVPNETIAAFGVAMADYINQLGSIVTQMEAIGTYESIEYGTEQYDQFDDLIDQLYDLDYPYTFATDMSTALNEEFEAIDMTDAFEALNTALENGFDAAM